MRTTPPYRAEHVGSLLRPKRLLEARAQQQAGKITAEQLRNEEDAAIRDAIALQEEVGLESITDGELRRGSWHMDFLYEIGGIERSQDNLLSRFHNDAGDIEFKPTKPEVKSKLALDHTIFGDAFEFLAANTPAGTPKLTIPSPSMAHYRGGRAAIDASVYPEMDAFWSDLAEVYRKEISRLFGRIREQGYSAIPLRLYFKDGLVKVEIGLAKGKKLYDKREDLKKKDTQRELSQALKARNRG